MTSRECRPGRTGRRRSGWAGAVGVGRQAGRKRPLTEEPPSRPRPCHHPYSILVAWLRLHGGVALFFSLPPSLSLLGLLSHIHTLTTKWQRDFFPLRAYRQTATDNDAGGGD